MEPLLVNMGMNLMYGNSTISHLIERQSDADFTIAIVRHSERPSFDDVPVEKQNEITITQRGVKAAKDFGRAVMSDACFSNLKVYHWGLKRCADTADAIASGAEDAGCMIRERSAKHLVSPIADKETFYAALKSGQWKKLSHDWQTSGVDHGALVPVKKFSSEVFGKLLIDQVPNRDELAIIATHDLEIFPLLSSVFGGEFNDVGYLDGLVMSRKGNKVALRYCDKMALLTIRSLIGASVVSQQSPK